MNKKKRGFTLVELIMAVVIAGIVSIIFAAVINGAMQSWLFLRDQRQMVTDAGSVMMRIVREIRRCNGTANIQAFNSGQFQFVDIDGNTVNFQLNGPNVQRNGVTLINNVSGLNFTYLDLIGAVTAARDSIRTVQITLLVNNGVRNARLQGAAAIRER